MANENTKRSLGQWLVYLEQLHTQEIDLGLDRVESVAETLGLLTFPAKIVTVAGTNGKGSCVRALSLLLKQQSLNVGAFTSPHIERYNERITIDGEPASDALICDVFELIEVARGGTSLSYFEFGTLAALLIFKRFSLDVIILEVGLGGRLDAVNIVDPDIAVITSIGLDHQAWLGNTRELIGAEKAGILREAIPFVCVDAEPPKSVLDRARALRCDTIYLNKDIVALPSGSGNGDSDATFQLDSGVGEIVLDLAGASLPVPSLLAAAQAFYLLGGQLESTRLESTLVTAQLEGRFERLSNSYSTFILDVAHNPQATELLAKRLSDTNWRGVCVLAVMKDKAVSELLKPLKKVVSDWVCTEIPDLDRSLSAAALSSKLDECVSVSTHSSPVEALENAVVLSQTQYPSDHPVLVLGSFYLVSEFKRNYWPTVKHK